MGAMAHKIEGPQLQQSGQDSYNAMQAINAVKSPTVAEMQVKLQGLVQQGILTPQQAQTFQQSASAYNAIDPQAEGSQKQALNALSQVVDERGLDPQARAALHQAQGQVEAQEQGDRQAILQNAASRGISGSGLELASEMGGQQNAATNLANQGFQTASDANTRYLNALNQMSNTGGQLFGEEATKANAQNAINQFNTANSQAVQNANVQANNAAAAQNLAEKQNVADTNTQTANQQQLYNKGLYQQVFQNQLGQAQAQANADLGSASNALNQGKEETQDLHNQTAKWSDEELKKNMKEIDPEKFLDHITGFKYEFKNKEHGKGPQIGVKAQDIEKVAPQAIEDHPGGKKINYAKIGGPALAALSSLHERVKNLEGK